MSGGILGEKTGNFRSGQIFRAFFGIFVSSPIMSHYFAPTLYKF